MDAALPAGTIPSLPRFPRMRIREENCNMILLAVVTFISVTVAGGANLLGFGDTKQVRFGDTKQVRLADRSSVRTEGGDKRIIHIADQPPVRVIGAPFVLNTNPHER